MRNWIKLVEYMGETLPDHEFQEVYDIVSQYVTSGEGASVSKMRELYDLVRRPDQGMTLHRVLRLSEDQMTQYRRDQTFELRPMEFASWTKCDDASKLLGQVKGNHTIVITQFFPAWEIVIDFDHFYLEYDMNHTDEYHRYVEAEQEVIVRHLAPIAVTAENSRAFTAGIVPFPKVGDEAFYFRSEDSSLVTEVSADQEFAHRGLYMLTFDGNESLCRYLGDAHGVHQWEDVEHMVQYNA